MQNKGKEEGKEKERQEEGEAQLASGRGEVVGQQVEGVVEVRHSCGTAVACWTGGLGGQPVCGGAASVCKGSGLSPTCWVTPQGFRRLGNWLPPPLNLPGL